MSTIKTPWHRANEPEGTAPYVKQSHSSRYVKKSLLKNSPALSSKTYQLLSPLPCCAKWYYAGQFPRLKALGYGWVGVHCCFHEDKIPSLRIHLTKGAFRCFGCGARGRDILAFHQKRYHLSFQEAWYALIARGVLL